MNWRIFLTSAAEKQLRRLTPGVHQRISGIIDEMATNPFRGDIWKLEGTENAWRRRVGSYRINFKLLVKERAIFIYEIKRRTSKTY